jgi:MFS-type transporter involved in bile tolerance (Atg22 family)
VAVAFESLAGVGALLAVVALVLSSTDLATVGVGVGVVGALGNLTTGFVRTAVTTD